MRRMLVLLGSLLVVQLVLAGWMYSAGRGNLSAFRPDEKLLGISADEVDKIVIEESGQGKVELVKDKQGWVIPASENFPAAPAKVEKLLQTLLGMYKSYPEANTAVAAKQFKVADDSFNRQIQLLQGGKTLASLLLGTSPGFRKVHARVAGRSEIHSIEFEAYLAPVKAVDWHDREVLAVPQSKLQAIEVNGIKLQKKDDKFQLADLPEKTEMNDDEVRSVVDKITGLRFEEMLGGTQKPEYKFDQAAVSFTVTKSGDQKVEYTAASLDEKSYVLKTSAMPYFFKVNKALLDRLKDVTRESLVKKAAEPEASPSPAPSPEQNGNGSAGEGLQTPMP